tara:strand:- start:1827 stop:2285 length:459 start_codon:yes stop_codon:yes gene_type:complete
MVNSSRKVSKWPLIFVGAVIVAGIVNLGDAIYRRSTTDQKSRAADTNPNQTVAKMAYHGNEPGKGYDNLNIIDANRDGSADYITEDRQDRYDLGAPVILFVSPQFEGTPRGIESPKIRQMTPKIQRLADQELANERLLSPALYDAIRAQDSE